jgi:hypothetical protein
VPYDPAQIDLLLVTSRNLARATSPDAAELLRHIAALADQLDGARVRIDELQNRRMRLTEGHINVLARAAWLERLHNAGVFPRGSAQYRQFAYLERRGFLVCDGWGRDIDGQVERDVKNYRLTDAGRSVLAQRGKT